MWGPVKLKEFAPKVDQRSAVGVGAGGNSGGWPKSESEPTGG